MPITLMPSGSNACGILLAFATPLTDLVHSGARRSVFSAATEPVARFATYFDEVAFTTSAVGVPTTGDITSYAKDLSKRGDRIGGLWVRMTGPLLAAVTSVAVTGAGATGSGAVRLVVDDIHHTRSQLRYVDVGTTEAGGIITDGTATMGGRLLKLSTIIDNNKLSVGLATSTTYTKTATALLSHVLSPYFNRLSLMPKYCDYAGAASIHSITITSAAEQIDKCVMQDIVNAEQFFPRYGQRMPGRLMNHGSEAERIEWASAPVEWLVPIPFWFARGVESDSLNFVALYGQVVNVEVQHPPFLNVIEGIGAHLAAQTAALGTTTSGGALSLKTTVGGVLGTAITPLGADGITPPATDLAATMFASSLVMQKYRVMRDERAAMFAESSSKLITVHMPLFDPQAFTNAEILAATTKTAPITSRLNIIGGVIAVRRGSEYAQNRHFNFTGIPSPLYPNLVVKDVMATIGVKFGTEYDFSMTPNMMQALFPACCPAVRPDLKGLNMFMVGTDHPYDAQKGQTIPLIKLDTPVVELVCDASAGADYKAQGGIAGETATAVGRAWCTQVLVTGDGGMNVLYK